MNGSLTIAIDFDNTFTADPDLWSTFIASAQQHGHTVICVSARRNELSHRQELAFALPERVPILLSYGEPKRMYAAKQGYVVDIWIDDCPEAIPTKEDMLRMCG